MLEKIENFEEVKQKGEAFYRLLQSVYCPYFKDAVHFTTEGLEHIKFKKRNVARPRQDQYMRFKLLKVVPIVLSNSRTVQGIMETKGFEKVRKHSRTEIILQPITFYEFIAVIDSIRVKVIVKQIDTRPYTFWSIIPFWGASPDNKRRLHSGNLQED